MTRSRSIRSRPITTRGARPTRMACSPRSSGPRGLPGAVVLDVGAGTGIATRQLAARGARTVAIDFGELMLRRAHARSPGLTCLQADGNRLPIRSGSVHLTCFAQSWHWFDQHRASREVARVLRPGGCWAAWWSHAWADGQDWFDTYQDVMEAVCPGYRASPRPGLERGRHRQHRAVRARCADRGAVDPAGGRGDLDGRGTQ